MGIGLPLSQEAIWPEVVFGLAVNELAVQSQEGE
jgi:hypothetical protein